MVANVKNLKTSVECYSTPGIYHSILVYNDCFTLNFYHFRSELADAVWALSDVALKERGVNTVNWVRVLPLHHFLCNRSRPFGTLKFRALASSKTFRQRYGNEAREQKDG